MINTDCIIPKGEVTRLGYIRLWNGGNRILAHRAAYEAKYGKIQEGLEIDHICHNRGCSNVEHLRLATRNDNMRNTTKNIFTKEDIPIIKTLQLCGMSYQRIANLYKCSKQSIWYICKGKQWA